MAATVSKPIGKDPLPIIIFPLLALGLAVVGILLNFVIKIASAHRARTIVSYPKPDKEEQWWGEQGQQPVDGQQTFKSLISAVSDKRALKVEDFQIAAEIDKRRDKLARLRQQLDQLLGSPAGPHHGLRQVQTAVS
jgi:hypothetical protein